LGVARVVVSRFAEDQSGFMDFRTVDGRAVDEAARAVGKGHLLRALLDEDAVRGMMPSRIV